MRAQFISPFLLAAGYLSLGTLRAAPTLPAPMAWLQTEHDQSGAVTTAEIIVIDGKRWRFEGLSSKKRWLIGVSDGNTANSNIAAKAPAEKLNPIPAITGMLYFIQHGSPKTEKIDGHEYLHYTEKVGDNVINVWSHPKTGFLFRFQNAGTFYEDVTFTFLPINDVLKIPNLFSLDALKPLLSGYRGTN